MRPDARATRIAATRESAEAMLEDLQHIRSLIAKERVGRDEIRRMSGILRRLLVEEALAAIAAPRVGGKISLSAPQNAAYYELISKTPSACEFFASGGADVFGLRIRAISPIHPQTPVDLDEVISLGLPNFLKQKVVYWKRAWVDRGQVIKYIANVAEGVHAGTPKHPSDYLLEAIRHDFVVGQRPNGAIGIAIRPPDEPYDAKRLGFAAPAIDLVLLEALAAGRYLVESEEVIALEAAITKELAEI